MQIATETLELRAQQDRVRSNELLNPIRIRRVQDFKMRAIRLDILEPGQSNRLPGKERVGRHQDT
jgi:hypothetical protein